MLSLCVILVLKHCMIIVSMGMHVFILTQARLLRPLSSEGIRNT
jgi:hypothetical protein